MKIEDRSFKFDFHAIPSRCFSIKIIVRTRRSGLTGPIFVTFQIVVSCTRLPGFVLLFAHASFSACIYHVSRNLSLASRTLAFTLVYSSLTGIASAPRISGDLNLIIIVVFTNCSTCRCFTIFLLHAIFIYVLFFCNKMPTRASSMHLG